MPKSGLSFTPDVVDATTVAASFDAWHGGPTTDDDSFRSSHRDGPGDDFGLVPTPKVSLPLDESPDSQQALISVDAIWNIDSAAPVQKPV